METLLSLPLIAVIIFQGIFMAWKEKKNLEEREKLIKALLARNLDELTRNEAEEKFKPKEELPEVPPDMVQTDLAEDTLFDRAIKNAMKQEEYDVE